MKRLRAAFHGESKFWWMFLAVCVAVYAVLSQSYSGRIELWHSNIEYCYKVTIPGTLDAIDRENDLGALAASTNSFATGAAKARRHDGDILVAEGYESDAAEAARIQKRSAVRAVNASKRAAVPCMQRFPKPKNPLHLPWD